MQWTDPVEQELRRGLAEQLHENAETHGRRLRTHDFCLRGRTTGAETGEVTEAVMRLFYIQDLLCCDVVELQDGRPIRHRYFSTFPDSLRLPRRDTVFLGKVVAWSDPDNSEVIPMDEYGALKDELKGT